MEPELSMMNIKFGRTVVVVELTKGAVANETVAEETVSGTASAVEIEMTSRLRAAKGVFKDGFMMAS
jgi:hypothetical protein